MVMYLPHTDSPAWIATPERSSTGSRRQRALTPEPSWFFTMTPVKALRQLVWMAPRVGVSNDEACRTERELPCLPFSFDAI